MKKCVSCGKSGLFLKLNERQLCESCAQKVKKDELSKREVANVEAQYVFKMAESIRDTVENMASMAKDCGAYSDETMESAVKMLTIAVEEAKKAVAVVRDPDVSKIGPTIENAKKIVEEMHSKTLELMGKAKY